jgi:hypothetical protein
VPLTYNFLIAPPISPLARFQPIYLQPLSFLEMDCGVCWEDLGDSALCFPCGAYHLSFSKVNPVRLTINSIQATFSAQHVSEHCRAQALGGDLSLSSVTVVARLHRRVVFQVLRSTTRSEVVIRDRTRQHSKSLS